ncbi:hypothetical protein [Variovorax sp. 3P27G3]|jgi:hypothetical protein|uniref:hypothetical protein n=1 Tax=Variovorax sp. 3P27G3 TaxID=2502214 RepID=UPI0010F9BE28|nr:hypothetical protein [Variovorax sp. 3P27G3]
MSSDIPSVANIRLALQGLSHAATQRLSKLSGVPFTTIWKIRDGTTKNPGIETVGQFVPYLEEAGSIPSEESPSSGATPFVLQG